METLINERVKVVTLFAQGKIKPILFKWQNRIHKILKVDFSYTKAVGKEKIFYFSIETESGVFELSFNREKFSWNLEKAF